MNNGNLGKFILVKNAIANVARGSSSALVAIALPPFLTRSMSPDAYGTWALILQISAYVGYLDFGIQTAVGRFVAHATEKGDAESRDSLVSTSLAALSAAGMIAITFSIVVAVMLPHLFKQLPSIFVTDARIALVLVSSSLAVGLPASVFNGIFIGLQRYEVPAAIIAGSRLVAAVLVILVVKFGGTLTRMGAVMAAINLASYVLQYLMYRRLAPSVRISTRLVSRAAGRELFDYCLSLTIWSFATLLVTGLDIILVGIFDFRSVAYYTIAATLITFILGLQNAIFGVLIPASAVLAARNRASELGEMLISSTRLGMLLLFVTGLPLLVATKPILSLWVGPVYAQNTALLLRVLVLANIIRMSALPYAMLLIGTGQQRLVIVTPLLEGCSNLFISIVAGTVMGAAGVAIGTLVGSIVGILVNIIYNIPRTTAIGVDLVTYLKEGLLRPVLCITPMLFVFISKLVFPSVVETMQIELFLAAALSTLLAFWSLGLTVSQRSRVLSVFGFAAR
ncbi:MAG: rane protein involved in the export of O-antigen and teichoic acid [Acidobacteriaceae bacterium]|nr:rane protein involved in the export of O-antigen and teichoic acid [Acidobacteriaceae bacterium]